MEDAAAGQGFQAKEEIVQTLISLGFSRNAAIKVTCHMYRKTKFSDTRKIAVIILKFKQCGPTIE